MVESIQKVCPPVKPCKFLTLLTYLSDVYLYLHGQLCLQHMKKCFQVPQPYAKRLSLRDVRELYCTLGEYHQGYCPNWQTLKLAQQEPCMLNILWFASAALERGSSLAFYAGMNDTQLMPMTSF
jgi:hypothetical protein